METARRAQRRYRLLPIAIALLRHDFTLQRTIGEPGRGPTGMSCPHDIFVSPDGVILVADAGNRRIQRYGFAEGRCLGSGGSYGEGPDQFLDPTGWRCFRTATWSSPTTTLTASLGGARFDADGKFVGFLEP